MMNGRFVVFTCLMVSCCFSNAQKYPRNYFRNPLNIPMQLVANFGELRANHWHMGLDIRTQQRENLPVYAAAEGYISRIKIEPGGFGRAIYITHPNGFTSLYAHLNNFFPALEQYVKQEQYRLESWAVELNLPKERFPVAKGEFIAFSGNTGGSQGPHVHFEIRDTKSENCLNPLLFGLPIADGVPPTVSRLAMYDRTRSVYEQSPQLLPLSKSGRNYTLSTSSLIKVRVNRLSFAVSTTDRFSNSTNPNGIYSARLLLDGEVVSGFLLDNISYNETRYLNAHIDYRYKHSGGSYVQHIQPLPGDRSAVYEPREEEAVLVLNDNAIHDVRIEVRDAAQNLTSVTFKIQHIPSPQASRSSEANRLIPNERNVFEEEGFEVFTTELAVYDTVPITYSQATAPAAGTLSALHQFCSAAIPVHDSITVRIKAPATLTPTQRDKVLIKSVAGSRTVVQKASWQNGWFMARFRQLGTFQAFIDEEPPTINAPSPDLSKSSSIVFVPKDNFKAVKSFRAELNGRWLRFTNDKGVSHIYRFDDMFPRGEHQLKVVIEDVAGNKTTKIWNVRR